MIPPDPAPATPDIEWPALPVDSRELLPPVDIVPPGARALAPRTHQFAESTIEAAVWLICWQPDTLTKWLDLHQPHGPALEAIARSQIKNIGAVNRRQESSHDLEFIGSGAPPKQRS